MEKVKKMLGVDLGAARTGLARSDDLGMYSVGMGNIKSYDLEKAAVAVAGKAAEIGADVIVIGKPVNMDGSCGEKAQNALNFGAMVSAHTDIPVEFFDERLTTVMAHQILGNSGVRAKDRKPVIDSLSAELILQGYMDMQKNKKSI
ncbi:MAG: Holliday junction resolvase RuvX [Clostridiales bacterium]|nr:Holliday junction resolvase RuvX [Clostridiales bacterium]